MNTRNWVVAVISVMIMGFAGLSVAKDAAASASPSWWVTFMNLLGCIGFLIAAVFAVVLPGAANETWITLSVVFTLAGAICFLVGSLLMLPESA